MNRINDPILRALIALTAIALLLAVFSAYGGVSIRIGPLLVRSHGMLRPMLVAAILAGIAVAAGRSAVAEALGWWWTAIERYAAAGAAGVSIAAVAVGLTWGTFVAGGSDSYCYLNQGELFARGTVRDVEPLSDDKSWPGTSWAFAPAGHIPLQESTLFLVPICPAGYPLLLAVARAAAGRVAMFWVTPILGGLTVALMFVFGRRLAGGVTGLLAALLTACSPTFLYQVVQPMNDVPAAALWCAAVIAALHEQRPPFAFAKAPAFSAGSHAGGFWQLRPRMWPMIAGLLTGLALTVRPNLLPLAAVTGLMTTFNGRDRTMRQRTFTLLIFGVAAAPGLAFVMAIQNAMYGSPLKSGYGDLSALFSLTNVWPNLERYPRWLVEVHTPLIAAALLAPFVLQHAGARRCARWAWVFVAMTLACYLPYMVYEAWWYTRFLLPAIPLLLALLAAVIVTLVERLPRAARASAFLIVGIALTVTYLKIAVARDVFRLHELERRFRSVGEYTATLPSNAAFVTNFHTGSIRFYSGRSTVGWEDIEPGRLDDAIEFLRRHGRKPYLVIEAWEEPEFKKRFANDRLGALRWHPVAEVDKVKVYDPADY